MSGVPRRRRHPRFPRDAENRGPCVFPRPPDLLVSSRSRQPPPREGAAKTPYQQNNFSYANTSAMSLSYETPPLYSSTVLTSLPGACSSMIFLVLSSGDFFRICRIFIVPSFVVSTAPQRRIRGASSPSPRVRGWYSRF